MREPFESWAQVAARYAIWSVIVSMAWAWRGPAGAILALGAGMLIQRGIRYGWWALQPGAARETYWTCLFAGMGRLAKSSGRVSKEDVAAVEALFQAMRMQKDQRALAIHAFNAGRELRPSLHRSFQRFRRLAAYQPGLQSDYLQVVVRTILRQRRPERAEHEALQAIAEAIGARAGLVEECLLSQCGSTARTNFSDPYDELGLVASASTEEIKRAYRSLMTRYHPDKLTASQVSGEERRLAEEKVRRIRAAYDELRKARGFR